MGEALEAFATCSAARSICRSGPDLLFVACVSKSRSMSPMALGASKQGTLTYIEPQENVPFNHELEMLRDDERSEINRILRDLTAQLRSHAPLIKGYLTLLIEFDVLQAKTKLAEMGSSLAPLFETG